MSRAHKDAAYADLTATVKAMANPARLEILDLLSQAPRAVEELADEVPYSFANVSQHLQVLRAAGLVVREADGRRARYRLAGPRVDLALAGVRALAGLSGGGDPELAARVERGEVLLLDVRPAHEFAHAHLPGARSVPPGEVESILDELPRDAEIVAYCRGPFCAFAAEAVDRLRAAGLRARVYDEGVSEWRARGLPLEAAS